MKIRPGQENDLPFIKQMLFEAFFWNSEIPRPKIEEFNSNEEFQKLLLDWGKRPGDRAFIAEDSNMPVGASWYRFWSENNHTYGFVNPETPELAIGVIRNYRSKGVGRLLLQTLVESAREEGIESISLSVDPSNYAVQLYESLGFQKVGALGTSWTMILHL